MDISDNETTRPVRLEAGSSEDTVPTRLSALPSADKDNAPAPEGVKLPPAASPTNPADPTTSPTAVTQRISAAAKTAEALPAAAAPTPDDLTLSSQPPEGEPPRRHNASWFAWAALGILALLAVAAISAFSGYQTAVAQRSAFQATSVANSAKSQFDLAVEDYVAQRYEFAIQRLEYVIQLDPNYPGALELLADAYVAARTTATPTAAPTATPTLTPTPNLDLISHEELFVKAQQLMAGADWSGAIDTLLYLRKLDADLRAVQIDGMLYVCLRQRGVDKIARQADLEGGIYDLSLAERFGPLDVEAKAWREWSQWYIRGASFWEVDWGKAVNYFSQIAPIAPNLRDASGWTATDRYRIALVRYGDWLAARGDWCAAQEQYALALSLLPDAQVQPTATYAADQCSSGESQPSMPSDEATPTPEPTTEFEQPTPAPSETPAPTSTPATPYP